MEPKQSPLSQETTPANQENKQFQQDFQKEVMLKLREMFQILKQGEISENRSQLKSKCHYLTNLGKQRAMPTWVALLEAAEVAIANKKNPYYDSAKLIIQEIQQAIELILDDRIEDIRTSEQLQALCTKSISQLDIEDATEVGLEALNTLADLFEEEIISNSQTESIANNNSLDEDTFAFFDDFSKKTENSTNNSAEDLLNLFDEDFSETSQTEDILEDVQFDLNNQEKMQNLAETESIQENTNPVSEANEIDELFGEDFSFDTTTELTSENTTPVSETNEIDELFGEDFSFDTTTELTSENTTPVSETNEVDELFGEDFSFDTTTELTSENTTPVSETNEVDELFGEDFSFDTTTELTSENITPVSETNEVDELFGEDFSFDTTTELTPENITPVSDFEPNSESIPRHSELEGFEELLEIQELNSIKGNQISLDISTEKTSSSPESIAIPDSEEEIIPNQVIKISGDEVNYFEQFEELENLIDEPAAVKVDLNNAVSFEQLEMLISSPANAVGVTQKNSDVSLTQSVEEEFEDLEELLKQADRTIGGPPTVTSTSAKGISTRTRTSGVRIFEQTMRVPVKQLDTLSNLMGELVVNRNSLEEDQERLRQFLDNLLNQVQNLSDVGGRMQDLYERSLLESSLLASRNSANRPNQQNLEESSANINSNSGQDYDPLEMDRFTGFHLLSQEMIELIVRVRESSSDIQFLVTETDQVARNLRQVTNQLQDGLTKARMVPFAHTADRLPRAVREISMRLNKQAQLQVEGREALIDKMILEHLYDPMTHLVNNAITHGIEPPQVRQAKGKSSQGKITISAFLQGNQTVISVADDGAGIDPEKIKTTAIEKGLITENEARKLANQETYDFLFHPGFTTKNKQMTLLVVV